MEVRAFPKSRKSWFLRLYYEYWYFYFFSKKLKPFFWLSLHDMTPNLKDTNQAVYCHNASPFHKTSFKTIFIDPKQFLFDVFYIYLYRINIKRNKYVILQQDWMRKEFIKKFELNKENVIVALPLNYNQSNKIATTGRKVKNDNVVRFFYPSFPRRFKNFEVICKAAGLIKKEFDGKFEIVLTVDGTENAYSKYIRKRYEKLDCIRFVGKITHEQVFDYYEKCDCLIFPSKLESWGLPISEFKSFNKPMIVSDLPYAKETVGQYDLVKFFSPDNAAELCIVMEELLNGKIIYEGNAAIEYDLPVANSWNALFDKLLSRNGKT